MPCFRLSGVPSAYGYIVNAQSCSYTAFSAVPEQWIVYAEVYRLSDNAFMCSCTITESGTTSIPKAGWSISPAGTIGTFDVPWQSGQVCGLTASTVFDMSNWDVCAPDSICFDTNNYYVVFACSRAYLYTRSGIPGYWSSYTQITTRQKIFDKSFFPCSGVGDGGDTGACVDSPCGGQCCEKERLLRVARCWGQDGNAYSVSQGTFARNAPGRGSTYPCGCSGVTPSQPQPAGDFFATDIHDRTTGKLGGTQSVSLWAIGGLIEGTSIETGGKVALFRTRDFGREFSVMDVPGVYDFIQSIPHNGRRLLFGYKKSTSKLYVRVGVPDTSGNYTWGGEKEVALPPGAPPVKCGDFTATVRPDGVVELLYLSGAPPCGTRLYRCHRIDTDGTNEWVG